MKRALYRLERAHPMIKRFVNQPGWMLVFKVTETDYPWVTIDTIDNVYAQLYRWEREQGNFFSAIIYAPNGRLYRTFNHGNEPFKATRRI